MPRKPVCQIGYTDNTAATTVAAQFVVVIMGMLGYINAIKEQHALLSLIIAICPSIYI